MKSNRAFAVTSCVLAYGSLLCATQALAGSFTYKKLDVAGQKQTYATGINDKDQVVGVFVDSGNLSHGFVWAKGVYTQVDGTGGDLTELVAVNAHGIAAGDYYESGTSNRIAFTYAIATGLQQTLKVNPKYEFYPNDINVKGAVVGIAEAKNNVPRGFVGKANGNNVKVLTFPGNEGTTAYGINSSGAVVGSHSNPGGTFSGYIYQSGTYTSFDPSGSVNTQVSFVTDDGVVGGYYIDGSGNTHGFTMEGGTFTVIDYPGSKGSPVIGIGPGGEVVGNWEDSSGVTHGYIEQGGTFYSIDVPGATSTTINGVNATGSLAGYTGNQGRGFIAECKADQSPCTQ